MQKVYMNMQKIQPWGRLPDNSDSATQAYDGTLVMPSNYALMDEEEICYTEAEDGKLIVEVMP